MVNSVNDKPIASDDTNSTTGTNPASGTVASNDSDPDGDNLTFTPITTLTTEGVLVLNPNGTYTFTPSQGFSGAVNIDYVVCDSGTPQLCDTGRLAITVTAIASNRAPIALNDFNNTIKNIPVNGSVSQNDSDPDGDAINVDTTPVEAPKNGNITLEANGNYTYTPNNEFVGADTILYKICDNKTPALCDTATLIIEVRPSNGNGSNQKPVANDDNTATPINTLITINVKSNDFDPDNSVLTAPSVVGTPTGGTTLINPDGTITFTPTTGFIGNANFQYSICDSGTPQLCDTATVTINVYQVAADNNPPIANNDAVSTPVNTPVNGNVAANDSDPDAGQTLTFTKIEDTKNGTVTFNDNGTFSYTPNTDFEGKDTFRYKVCDSATPSLCEEAIVIIAVIKQIEPSTNDAPVANPDGAVTTTGLSVNIPVKANDFDPNGQPLSLPSVTTPSTDGTATVNPDGTITFLPNIGFNGTTTFIYEICDNGTPVKCDTAIVTVNVRENIAQDNRPPVAQDDIYVENKGSQIGSTVALNDSDPDDGQVLTFTPLTLTSNGTLTFLPSGVFIYEPIATFVGLDTAVYQVCDNGTPQLCDTAYIIFNMIDNTATSNGAPFAGDDAASTTLEKPVTINVKDNDRDPNAGQTLGNPNIIGTPIGGTAVVNPDGTVTFTPADDFTGAASFQYSICDNGSPSLCDTAKVTITVSTPTFVNVAPNAQSDATTTPVNTPVNGNVSINDSDLNTGQILTFTQVSNPQNGSVTLNPTGTFTYTPNNGFVGRDSFTYKVCDNGTPPLCDEAWVYIEVTPANTNINLPPVAIDDKATTTVGVPVIINVKSNDYDPNVGQVLLKPVIIDEIDAGRAVVNADGTITFTPNPDFTGIVTFRYEICDNGSPSLCDTALVTIDVKPVNSGNLKPVAGDDAYPSYKNKTLNGDVSKNDSDPNTGQTLTYSVITSTVKGKLTLNTNGTFIYVPDSNYLGPDQFTYRVCDNGTPQLCDTGAVFITIYELPFTVTVSPVTVLQDSSVKQCFPITATATDSVFTTALCDSTKHGKITHSIVNKQLCIEYIPNEAYNGKDSVCIKVCNSVGSCVDVNIPITVVPTLTKRIIARDDSKTTGKNQPVSISVLQNDSIGSLTGVRLRIIGAPTNGTAVVTDSLTIVYTPNLDTCGNDQLMYEVCNAAGCDTAMVDIKVICGDLVVFNALSPNGDGKNDVFYIQGIEKYPNNKLVIYNRWGNEVFKATGYLNNWGGNWNGMMLPDGTYFYILDTGEGQTKVGYIQIHR
jgi:gliding motility-associated-like protein